MSSSNYNLDGTTLTVQLGDLAAGDKVEVRTTGRKVTVTNGAITVLDATKTGNRLDTKIQIDSWSSDAHIGLGGSPDARRIHYAYKESWSSPNEYTRFKDSGAQQLYLPNAQAGGDARISTIPVKTTVQSGDAEIKVPNPKTSEPEFTVSPGATSGDTVEYTFVSAKDDTKYLLWSETNGIQRDSGTANSPLTLEDDDSAETLVFLLDDGTSTSSDGGGGGGVFGPVRKATVETGGLSIPVTGIGAGLLGVIGIAAAIAYQRRRSAMDDGGGSSRARGLVRRVIGTVTSLLATVGIRGGGILFGALKLLNRAALRLLANRYAAAFLAVGALVALAQAGLVRERLLTLGASVIVLIGAAYGLQRLNLFTTPRFLVIALIDAIATAELLSPGIFQQVARDLPLQLVAVLAALILGGYIWLRRREASTPETVNRLVFRGGGGGNG